MAETAVPKLAYVATLVSVGRSLRCDYVLANVKHRKFGVKTLSLHLTQPGWAMALRARPLFTVVGAQNKPRTQPRSRAPPALGIAAGSPLPQLATPSEGGAGSGAGSAGARSTQRGGGLCPDAESSGLGHAASRTCPSKPKPRHEMRGAARGVQRMRPGESRRGRVVSRACTDALRLNTLKH